MLLTNRLAAEPTSTETRAHWRNTTLSIEMRTTKMVLESAVYEVLLSNANANGYTMESQRDCVLLVWVLTVWCVQFGFGLWRAIFHGVQRVGGWYHIFDTLLVLFLQAETIGWLKHALCNCLFLLNWKVTGIIILNVIIIPKWLAVITGCTTPEMYCLCLCTNTNVRKSVI